MAREGFSWTAVGLPGPIALESSFKKVSAHRLALFDRHFTHESIAGLSISYPPTIE
jgi:hypothetical protein